MFSLIFEVLMSSIDAQKYAHLWCRWLSPQVSKACVFQLANLLKEYSHQQRVYAVEHNYYHIISFLVFFKGHGSKLSEICCPYQVTIWQVSWNLLRDLNCKFVHDCRWRCSWVFDCLLVSSIPIFSELNALKAVKLGRHYTPFKQTLSNLT